MVRVSENGSESPFQRAVRRERAIMDAEMRTIGSAGGFGMGLMLPPFATPEQRAAAYAEYERLIAKIVEKFGG